MQVSEFQTNKQNRIRIIKILNASELKYHYLIHTAGKTKEYQKEYRQYYMKVIFCQILFCSVTFRFLQYRKPTTANKNKEPVKRIKLQQIINYAYNCINHNKTFSFRKQYIIIFKSANPPIINKFFIIIS